MALELGPEHKGLREGRQDGPGPGAGHKGLRERIQDGPGAGA